MQENALAEIEQIDEKEQLNLSPREKEIFAMLLTDAPQKAISTDLKISRSTVNFHVKNLYRKLGIQSRIELITKYGNDPRITPQPEAPPQDGHLPLKIIIPAAAMFIASVALFLIWLAPWKAPEVVFNFWYALGDEKSTTHVTRKNETIDGVTVNAVTISGTYTEGNENFTGVYGRPNGSTLETIRNKTKSISFKVLGDGNYYALNLPTFETMNGDHYLYVFPTVKNEELTVIVNIPDDLSRQGWSGKEAVFTQNNILFFLFQPAQYGGYNLKFWDINLHKQKMRSKENSIQALKITNTRTIIKDQIKY